MEIHGTRAAVTNFVKRLDFFPAERENGRIPEPEDGKRFYRAVLNMDWDSVLQEIDEKFIGDVDNEENFIGISPSFAYSASSCLFLVNHNEKSIKENNVISLQDACAADCVDVAFDADNDDGELEIGEADRYGNYRIASKKLATYICGNCGEEDYLSVGKESEGDFTCEACDSDNIKYEQYGVEVHHQSGTPCIPPLT
jgi:hypothetical protein